jgi:hypothetical protein
MKPKCLLTTRCNQHDKRKLLRNSDWHHKTQNEVSHINASNKQVLVSTRAQHIYAVLFFLKTKKGSGTHSDTKFGQGGVVIPMPRKKVLECHSSMHPSERELLECKSSKTIK